MTAPRENAIGSRLGRYELKSRIAVGGMAEVWLAEASGISGFKKTVVLKTILPQYAHEPSFVRMLTNEAVLASGLSHANIVQIFDLGEIEGTYFIAMEYIAGLTLRQVQRMVAQQSARAPIWLVLHVVMSVCDALDYAHGFAAEGHPQMVHRDVSPENVMLSFAGVTKVLDFGIAKARSGHLTQPGTLQGKFAYMSPERIGSETQTDLRSDIYSIGVMLYELLVGRQPFQEVNELQLLGRILDHEPPAPREAAPWVPEALEKIVQKAMAKDPARRHQTAAELREDLSRFLVESRATTTSDRDVARFLSKLVATQKETERSNPPKLTPSRPLTGFDATRGPTAEAVLPPDDALASRNVPLATPAPSPMNVLRVLVVDADRVTRRFVELALTSDGFEVESAKTGSAALEILQSDPVDLIITDSDLPDMTGLRLHRRLSQQSRYRDIPVVFLSADTRAATKAVALHNGVEEYLAKPCEATELAARVKGLIWRRRRLQDAMRQQHRVLAGDLSVLGFPVLVGMLSMERHSGTLTVNTDRSLGFVTFSSGRITHACFGSLVGEPAVYRLMAETAGRFDFSPGTTHAIANTQVSASVMTLLTIGVKLVEADRLKLGEAAPTTASEGAAKPESAKLIASPAPTVALATQFELGVRDAFSMGELRMCDAEELASWGTLPGGRERFRVLLVAHPAAGVSALLPLSSPPTEREILAGLAAGEKMVGLDFFLRDERLLDIVLVDIAHPLDGLEKWLKRQPALVLLAPRDAAVLEEMSGELETLLHWTAPRAVVGVGDAAVEGLLQRLVGALVTTKLRCLPGTLETCDLRAVLIEGIRLWAPPAGTGQLKGAP